MRNKSLFYMSLMMGGILLGLTLPLWADTAQFSAPSYSVDENVAGGTMTITVERVGGGWEAFTVRYHTEDGSATAGADYTAASGQLDFAVGDVSKTFVVPITDDTNAEGDESLSLVLTESATGNELARSTLTIIDKGRSILQFVPAFYEVDEGTPSVTIAVTRSPIGGAEGTVTVHYQAALPAGWPVPAKPDFIPISGDLIWAPGDMSPKTFDVSILDDDEDEFSGIYVDLQLSSPTGGGQLGSNDNGVVTIVDNDDQPCTETYLSFELPTYEANEESGTILVGVGRFFCFDGEVRVDYEMSDGTAKAGEDYVNVSGSLIWENNDANVKYIPVQILPDDKPEGIGSQRFETVNLTLTHLVGGAGILGDQAVLHINDNDGQEPGSLVFRANQFTVREDTGVAKIQVDRVGGSYREIYVSYRTEEPAAQAATAGQDYGAVSGLLHWADGDSAPKEISVPIYQDSIKEKPELLNLTLSHPTNGATLGTPATAGLTILDDDSHPGQIDIEGGDSITVLENQGKMVFTLLRKDGADWEAAVDYAIEGETAEAGADFVLLQGTLRWENGDAAPKTVEVTLLDDPLPEEDKTFALTLSHPSPGIPLIRSRQQVVIRSDDFPAIDAGPDKIVRLGGSVNLSAAMNPFLSVVKSQWSLESGPGPVTIENPNALAIVVRPDQPGTYVFTFTASLGFGLTQSDTVRVVVDDSGNVVPIDPASPNALVSTNLFDLSKGEQADIRYQLSEPGEITITIYDRLGREVIPLLNGFASPGVYSQPWNGRDADGALVAAGVYTAHIKEGSQSRLLKIIVLR
ncbi:MAG: hypothetical protein LHV69_07645 [Elusimicrobia bacterium]|nr:hypothetical protein [Candidatus Obscuribacterium magneticum]